jgi:hypothetical protein
MFIFIFLSIGIFMLLSLEPNQDIQFLKWEAALQTRDQKFPHAAAQKLKEILMDDQIKPEEFITKFNEILASTESLSWKIYLSINDIKDKFFDQILRVSWFQIIIILFIFSFLLFIKNRFKLKIPRKTRKKILFLISNILERCEALLAYFVPIIILYANYLPRLLPRYHFFTLIIPDFFKTPMSFYMQHPNIVSYGYFFLLINIAIQRRLPRCRFVRFHLVRGLMLMACQGIPGLLYSITENYDALTPNQTINMCLGVFVINLFWTLPCLYQAITHSYPKSSFMREAIEVQLGRDDDENFKWWDR